MDVHLRLGVWEYLAMCSVIDVMVAAGLLSLEAEFGFAAMVENMALVEFVVDKY